MDVAIGIDSHKASLGIGVVDEVGREVDAREFDNDHRGHVALLKWIRRQGTDRVIGIEGSANYGHGLARFLIAMGEEVVEVPPFLTFRERKRNPSKGKSDLADGISIARVVARGEGLAAVVPAPLLEDLKLLSDHRDQLVCTRTQVANQAHANLAIARPGYHKEIPDLRAKRRVAAARALMRADQSVRAGLLRDQLAELVRLDERIAAVTKELAAKVTQSGTRLTELKGISFVLAAKILGEVGDVRRIRSAAAFAMQNGTAPLPASSGSTKRHRLNRGGNRQLNLALHLMATTLCRCDTATKAYMARRMAEGKTRKESLRCLKRHLSNVVYRCLVTSLERQQIAA
jgi:transposase